MSDLTERLCADEWGPYAPERRAAAKEIERLQTSLAYNIEALSKADAMNAKLQAVVDAAKDMTSEQAYWNPDTGNYDLYKSNGTLEQLIEALAALEGEDNGN